MNKHHHHPPACLKCAKSGSDAHLPHTSRVARYSFISVYVFGSLPNSLGWALTCAPQLFGRSKRRPICLHCGKSQSSSWSNHDPCRCNLGMGRLHHLFYRPLHPLNQRRPQIGGRKSCWPHCFHSTIRNIRSWEAPRDSTSRPSIPLCRKSDQQNWSKVPSPGRSGARVEQRFQWERRAMTGWSIISAASLLYERSFDF
jgi:hypothetical protein